MASWGLVPHGREGVEGDRLCPGNFTWGELHSHVIQYIPGAAADPIFILCWSHGGQTAGISTGSGWWMETLPVGQYTVCWSHRALTAFPSSTSGGLSALIPAPPASSSPSSFYIFGCCLLLKCLRRGALELLGRTRKIELFNMIYPSRLWEKKICLENQVRENRPLYPYHKQDWEKL